MALPPAQSCSIVQFLHTRSALLVKKNHSTYGAVPDTKPCTTTALCHFGCQATWPYRPAARTHTQPGRQGFWGNSRAPSHRRTALWLPADPADSVPCPQNTGCMCIWIMHELGQCCWLRQKDTEFRS